MLLSAATVPISTLNELDSWVACKP